LRTPPLSVSGLVSAAITIAFAPARASFRHWCLGIRGEAGRSWIGDELYETIKDRRTVSVGRDGA
jgi:hypothetical protein